MAIATAKAKLRQQDEDDNADTKIGGISSNDLSRYLPPGGEVRFILRLEGRLSWEPLAHSSGRQNSRRDVKFYIERTCLFFLRF